MDLFEHKARKVAEAARPLAERMRPKSLAAFVGQQAVVGSGAMLRRAIEQDRLFSIILWGPPGCGKTTLAGIIAVETQSHFVQFSAVLSGVKDIRAVIAEARDQQRLYGKRTLLFVDEIHRFNKSQQDAFLQHVESGLLTLIGATTENPSFEVIAPLLSRCRVVVLAPLSDEELKMVLQRALSDSKNGLGKYQVELQPEAMAYLVGASQGDARVALNGLEVAVALFGQQTDSGRPVRIGRSQVAQALQKKALRYDKSGEEHYNVISAFHKSLRGSDPDAALYWLARMLVSGEDPLYVARRMVRFASEDIGMADPNALGIAFNAMRAFQFLGHPEGELALAQAAIYLATAPKSNRVYLAYGQAQKTIASSGSLPVPLHIRNAPTALMQRVGYGKGYRYAHEYEEAYVPQDYLPEELRSKTFYRPSTRGYEQKVKERLAHWQQLKQSVQRQEP